MARICLNSTLFQILKNSDYQLVIIAHDHEQGYGEGYYIATPTHDSLSVSLGEAVHQLLPDFNYYPGSTTTREKSTSISQVDRPLTTQAIQFLSMKCQSGTTK
jgi:hypothetical protein